MKRFLLVAPFSPSGAPTTGGEQRLVALREELEKFGEVHVCVPEKKRSRPELTDAANRVWRIPGRVSWRRNPFRRLVNQAAKFAFGWIESWENAKTQPFATELPLAESFPKISFDAIVLRTFEEARLFRPWKLGVPVYVDLDDSPLETFDTRFAPRIPSWRRGLCRALLRRRLRRMLAKCAGGWLANESSVTELELPSDRFVCLPNKPMPPPAEYCVDAPNRDSLLFVGSFGYGPNVEAVDRFVSEIWPAIHSACPQLTFRIVGGGLASDVRSRWSAADGVEVVGFAESLVPHYERAFATAVPMWSGSGTAIKVMESLAYGRCCVASPFGARGWKCGADGIDVCVSPEEWSAAVVRAVGRSPSERTEAEALARATLAAANLDGRFAAAVRSVLDLKD